MYCMHQFSACMDAREYDVLHLLSPSSTLNVHETFAVKYLQLETNRVSLTILYVQVMIGTFKHVLRSISHKGHLSSIYIT